MCGRVFLQVVLIFITFIGVLWWGRLFTASSSACSGSSWLGVRCVWLVGISVGVGAAMYVNAVSWILIALLGLMHPVRLVIGEHPWNQNPSWSALLMLIWLNENAKPLIISASHAELFADWLVRLAPQQPVPNRAAPPPTPAGDLGDFHERIGNALLAGCIIETPIIDPDFPRQVWGRFYKAIGDIAIETGRFTRASVLENCHEGASTRTFWRLTSGSCIRP